MVAAMSFYSPISLGYLRLVIIPSRFAPITPLPDPAKINWVRRVNGAGPFSRIKRCALKPR
jgi:hypothetical protein